MRILALSLTLGLVAPAFAQNDSEAFATTDALTSAPSAVNPPPGAALSEPNPAPDAASAAAPLAEAPVAEIPAYVPIKPAPVNLRAYTPLEKLPARARSRTLPSLARTLVVVPNAAAFVGVTLNNSGLVFQAGTVNPVRFNTNVPFCTMKFVWKKKDESGREHYFGDAELIERTIAGPIVSQSIRKNYDPISRNIITMIDVNSAKAPSDTVDFIHCMVSINKEDLYREPTVAQILKAFGPSAKLYVKLR